MDIATPRVDLQLIPSVTDPHAAGRRKERLFVALDGSRIRRAGQEFFVEVYSIADDVAYRWLQLGLRGTETLITLRLPRQAGFLQAQDALLTWAADPTHIPGAVEAA